MLRRAVFRGAACAASMTVLPAAARLWKTGIQDYESDYKTLKKILEQPEAQIDLASIKLSVDQLIEPSIDTAALLHRLDEMTMDVAASIPPGASNLAKFKALRGYLYQPPSSSGRKPFRYNLEDDRNPRAKLLSVYLATRKGNCVSMPLLFVILAQRLRIPVALAAAPAHLYVKFRGDNGNWYGVETTSGGGWADDSWQKSQFPNLTQKAIENGIYLQPLTQKESAVVVVDSILEHYEHQRTLEANQARIRLALLEIDHYPKNVIAMVHACLGYRELRQMLFVEKYPLPADIPRDLRPQFEHIEASSTYWGNKARELGFLGTTPQQEAAYRERIRRALAVNENR